MLVRGYAAQHGGGRAVLLVCPGWIPTDMGGASATYSIDDAIPAVVNIVTAQQGRLGLCFIDRFGKTLPW